MATGLVVADADISVGGRVTPGANLGRMKVAHITHTSDTALSTKSAGGTQLGAASSQTVPTAGVIRVTVVELEIDETEGTNNSRFLAGLKVGADGILWPTFDTSAGAATDILHLAADTSVTSVLVTNGVGNLAASTPSIMTYTFDIVGRGISTGTQDIEVWGSDNMGGSVGEVTVTGTTVTARFLVEIIDGS